jgi:RimJ/RimL family protein N-acetyltransferase
MVQLGMAPPPILLDLPDAIETARLILRAPGPGDGPAVNAAILETWDALHHWLPWARERPSIEQTEAIMRQGRAAFTARTDLPMLMFLADGTLVGGTGLHRMDWEVPRFEIGYWVRRRCEGQGYVTEAVTALVGFALGRLAAARVEIHCSHRNERSQRVAERCGFVLEARLRNHGRDPSGELRDQMVYALVPGDRAARPAS